MWLSESRLPRATIIENDWKTNILPRTTRVSHSSAHDSARLTTRSAFLAHSYTLTYGGAAPKNVGHLPFWGGVNHLFTARRPVRRSRPSGPSTMECGWLALVTRKLLALAMVLGHMRPELAGAARRRGGELS